MVCWLYQNRKTGQLIWSRKIITEMYGGRKKWSIISSYPALESMNDKKKENKNV